MTATAEALPLEAYDHLDNDAPGITLQDIEVAQRALWRLKAAGHNGYVDVGTLNYSSLTGEEDNVTAIHPSSPAEPEVMLKAAPRDLDYEHYKDLQMVATAKTDVAAMDRLIREHTPLIRQIASAYFLAGGEDNDLIQEGLLGLYKAARDYDGQSSFRNFAGLCAHRQIITAVKTATRHKHQALNQYVSFSHTPAGQEGEECTVGDALPGPAINDPALCVISTEELQALVGCLGSSLSPLEADALRLYLEGSSYDEMAEELGCAEKTIDNALQRTKRKILTHQSTRAVLDA